MSKYVDLAAIAERYNTEDKAREYFESLRWPNGAICPHCGCKNAFKIGTVRGPKVVRRKPSRPGLWKCIECKDHFTVTEGTVMERTHIPLQKWLLAFFMLGSSKKGMSAHQLHRNLGITYRSAFFMAHRIRYAMMREPLASRLEGVVEIDETWIGPREHREDKNQPLLADPDKPKKHPRRNRYTTKKKAVLSLVTRGGESRSFHVPNVRAANLRGVIAKHVHPDATIYTDSLMSYRNLDEYFLTHESVNHTIGEYVRGEVSTNTVEGFFSVLKRGIYGVYQHVSEQHLHRYLSEFDFRYTRRKMNDGDRSNEAIKMTQGKRLMYRQLPPGRYEKPEGQWPPKDAPKKPLGPLAGGEDTP